MRNRMRMGGYLSALLVGGALFTAAILGYAADQTLEGTVTDAMCGMKHKGADAKACTMACAANGGYALVVGDKVYKLKGKEADLAKFAGAKASVTGAVNGMDVQVSAVSAPGSGGDEHADHMNM